MIKESKFNRCSSQTLRYAELPQFSLKEDLVNNGYALFAEEVISKLQYAEEFIKSFQCCLVTTLSHFWVSQRRESLCPKQKSSRIGLITSSWPELWKINTSLRSEFILHNSGHSEFIYHKWQVKHKNKLFTSGVRDHVLFIILYCILWIKTNFIYCSSRKVNFGQIQKLWVNCFAPTWISHTACYTCELSKDHWFWWLKCPPCMKIATVLTLMTSHWLGYYALYLRLLQIITEQLHFTNMGDKHGGQTWGTF